MKKTFENVTMECWDHSADLRFGVKPPFLCVKGGPEACDVMLTMLDELSGLRAPNQRSMTLKNSPRPNACRKIKFIISPPDDELTEMSLSKESDTAIFEFTLAGLKKFREAIVQWGQGKDDFSIHPNRLSHSARDRQSGEVWFWTPLTEP